MTGRYLLLSQSSPNEQDQDGLIDADRFDRATMLHLEAGLPLLRQLGASNCRPLLAAGEPKLPVFQDPCPGLARERVLQLLDQELDVLRAFVPA